MKLSKELIQELQIIMQAEFGYEIKGKDLEKFAYSLVGYFDLLQKLANRHKFGNSPSEAIDSSSQDILDKGRKVD